MLRPKRMSKVSVTGSKRVMDEVIEAVHDLNLLHVSAYDGSWEGFERGDPVEGAEEVSEKLVTVRSVESILEVDADEAGPTQVVTDETLEAELESIRAEVNELDDRREEIESELRDIEEEIEAVEPFADLGIDLDLLGGYDTLDVRVGEGDAGAVREALAGADGIDAFEVFGGDGVAAAFARPAGDAEDPLADALVGVEFAALTVPDAEGSPEAYVEQLEERRAELAAELESVEEELAEVRLDAAGFLLAAEEQLSIDVQKREAPLSFATTENAFVAEGWVPTERYDDLAAAVAEAVGDHAEVEELERASFTSDGEAVHEAAPDGGVVTDEEPPVVQDNPGIVSPFELLTRAVGRPKYTEFDPTVVLFLTFPAFFGFMIGDLGYGALYTLIGYYLYATYESDAFRSMGGITMAAGLFTMLFGVLYGEIFGLHLVSTYLWEGALGLHGSPLHKGLSPADLHWAQAWLVVSTLVALVHLDVGYLLGFAEELEFHGLKAALLEKGSWLLGMNGLWLFVFSRLFVEKKPGFLFEVFNAGEGAAFALGFAGFPPVWGWVGLGAFLLGAVMLAVGAPEEILEVFDVLVNVLSYTRIAAVLLAKAGMAFVVNLLFFGVYAEGEPAEFHFMLTHGPEYVLEHHSEAEIVFRGLLHGGVGALLGGLVILVLGHLLVLALGVTSAGLQAVRLEYYEFFTKFYEGGGREYDPFGRERRFTAEE